MSATASIRPAKIDAWLSAGMFFCVAFAAIANELCAFNPHNASIQADWALPILIAVFTGVGLAVLLSARVFWRHRIGLGAWMAMFLVNAFALLLTTQLIRWLHPSVNTAVANQPREMQSLTILDTVLLAVMLTAVMLVRGAALLKDARRMPDWMAKHTSNGDATPRLWLFLLFWITPIAWWGLFYCALYIWELNGSSAIAKTLLALCVFLIVVRTAVRLVLFEKNKFTNFQRNVELHPKFLRRVSALGMSLAALLTFYAYLFMSTRVQTDALLAQMEADRKMLASELAEFKAEPVNAQENAEPIYLLARTSGVSLTQPWYEEVNWRTAECEAEVAKNITALSYFRQATARNAIDHGIDFSDPVMSARGFSGRWRMAYELPHFSALELRQAAAKKDWATVLENFRAGLHYARVYCAQRVFALAHLQSETESVHAGALAAALRDGGTQADDKTLVSLQAVLNEYVSVRQTPVRSFYHLSLVNCATNDLAQGKRSTQWEYPVGVVPLIYEQPLLLWHGRQSNFDALAPLKLLTREKPGSPAFKEFQNNYPNSDGARYMRGFDDQYSVAILRMLDADLGVIRYRRYHGHWPKTLDECVPQFLGVVPLDPWMPGERIHYESESPARIYSAGRARQYQPQLHGRPTPERLKQLFEPFAAKWDENLVLFLEE